MEFYSVTKAKQVSVIISSLLQQYRKAIAWTRAGVANGTEPLLTTLIACMLISYFETYHGDHQAALNQMRIGDDLIAAWFQVRSRGFSSTSYKPEPLEDENCEAFDRLDNQDMTSPNSRSIYV